MATLSDDDQATVGFDNQLHNAKVTQMIKVKADGFRGYGYFVTLMLSVTFILIVLIVSPGVKHLNTFQLQKRIRRQCGFAAGLLTQYSTEAPVPHPQFFISRLNL